MLLLLDFISLKYANQCGCSASPLFKSIFDAICMNNFLATRLFVTPRSDFIHFSILFCFVCLFYGWTSVGNVAFFSLVFVFIFPDSSISISISSVLSVSVTVLQSGRSAGTRRRFSLDLEVFIKSAGHDRETVSIQ